MLKINVNWPKDMTEVNKRLSKFKADIIISECKKNNIELEFIIKYLEKIEFNTESKTKLS